MAQAIGIDLGTFYLKAAYVNKEGFVELLKDRNGSASIPSIVAFSSEKIVVGKTAEELLKTEPANGVKFPLLHLADADWRFFCEGKEFQATLLVAFMLKYLKQEIEVIVEEEVFNTVITIPSYFGDIHRRAVLQAADIVGLKVLRIVNEATAVGLACVHTENIESGKIIVCNLGDGPFEASAMSVEDRGIKVLSTSSTSKLSGRKCKTMLAGYLDERFKEETSIKFAESPEERERLYASAERVFRALSDEHSTDAHLFKTLLSGFAKDVKELDYFLSRIKELGQKIKTVAPFDYYAYLEMPRSATMEQICEKLNELKMEKAEVAQDAPVNADRYRAADELLIIAKAGRIFNSEASRGIYDAELKRYEKSFLGLALTEAMQNESINERQFEESQDFKAIAQNALDAMASTSGMVRVINSTFKNVLEYYSEKNIDAKLILDREILVTLFQAAMSDFYACIEETAKGAGWKMEEVGKVVFAGGFSQSLVLPSIVKAYMQEVCADIPALQLVSIDFAARGALLNANMLLE